MANIYDVEHSLGELSPFFMVYFGYFITCHSVPLDLVMLVSDFNSLYAYGSHCRLFDGEAGYSVNFLFSWQINRLILFPK